MYSSLSPLAELLQHGFVDVAHIKLHRNPKTNLKAKTHPNPKLQKCEKKTLKKFLERTRS